VRQTYRAAKRYRSMMFVPGHKLDWMLKAPQYGPDAVIFDLEDAAPISQKPAAREAIREALSALKDLPCGRFVRLNGWHTGGNLLEDVTAVVREGLDGVLLPKTEDVEDVAGLDLLLGELEAMRGLPEGHVEIIPLFETTRSMYRIHDICAVSERVRRAMGPGGSGAPGTDITRELGTHPEGFEDEVELYVNGSALIAVRAAGVTQIIGGSSTFYQDLAHVRRMALRGKRFGATGAFCYHPSQVSILNEVFTPSAEEIREAHEVLEVMGDAIARGHAAVRHNDRFLDYAHVRASLQLLSQARDAGIDVGDIPEFDVL
jgi:citrate lyase subunit beta / citryl-CoA lyase